MAAYSKLDIQVKCLIHPKLFSLLAGFVMRGCIFLYSERGAARMVPAVAKILVLLFWKVYIPGVLDESPLLKIKRLRKQMIKKMEGRRSAASNSAVTRLNDYY